MILRQRRAISPANARPLTVALVGADGAGKSTQAARLQAAGLPGRPVKRLYMGVSRQSSNHMLPTTRLLWRLKRLAGHREQGGPPRPIPQSGKSRRRRLLRHAKGAARLCNLLAEEAYRQRLADAYRRRGYTILFDRHFYLDYYAHDVAPEPDERSIWQRLHGFALQRVLPKPDLVILLDAPAALLFARKPEGSVALLEARRQEYLRLLRSAHARGLRFAVVDAAQSEDEVAAAIVNAIDAHAAAAYRDLANRAAEDPATASQDQTNPSPFQTGAQRAP